MADGATLLTLAGNIDRQTFLRFAMYDNFIRKRAWRSPALFAAILTGFALICFAGRRTHAQAALLGGVLLGVGLLLPLTWFGMYFFSLLRQAKRSGLSADRPQYFVTLSPEKLHVEKGAEQADFPWAGVFLACRVKGCLYLYVSPTRAFLLPDCEKTERAWALITAALPGESCVDRR